MPSRPWEESPNRAAIIEKVQAILRSKSLTLYAVSQRSAALYGRSSPYYPAQPVSSASSRNCLRGQQSRRINCPKRFDQVEFR